MKEGTIIAVDGHSSTGKSTFAKLIASRYGLIYVDTGALYRGVTLYAIENSLIDSNNIIDETSLKDALEKLELSFRPTGVDGATELFIGERNIERIIRGLKVSSKVSFIASLPMVRSYVDTILAKYGRSGGVIMDGRDIGTVVFPNAEIKIFMTASAEVRAKRRYKEMISRGENPNFESVLANVKERDYLDENRDTAPLKRAPDALLLDNSTMTIEDQLKWFEQLISKQ
ncbi:MAG: (d)CMP kinase [Bacteroidales bacterium]|nr:(d)CMP kinase [Bacteroidales bacterium]MDD3273527.1 (d)CMP kinase [Bacteroidales bacterium]